MTSPSLDSLLSTYLVPEMTLNLTVSAAVVSVSVVLDLSSNLSPYHLFIVLSLTYSYILIISTALTETDGHLDDSLLIQLRVNREIERREIDGHR